LCLIDANEGVKFNKTAKISCIVQPKKVPCIVASCIMSVGVIWLTVAASCLQLGSLHMLFIVPQRVNFVLNAELVKLSNHCLFVVRCAVADLNSNF